MSLIRLRENVRLKLIKSTFFLFVIPVGFFYKKNNKRKFVMFDKTKKSYWQT